VAKVNVVALYLLLLKAALLSVSGLSSLPVVRADLVVRHRVLTDRQLSAAVAAGRTAPGPHGAYLVSVGYFIAGVPGACAGALAVMTPAFLIIPMLRYLGARAERPIVRSIIECVMLGAAGLIISATLPLARESITGWVGIATAAASFALLAFTRAPTLAVMAGAAAAGMLALI
jgi:chromate transporter